MSKGSVITELIIKQSINLSHPKICKMEWVRAVQPQATQPAPTPYSSRTAVGSEESKEMYRMASSVVTKKDQSIAGTKIMKLSHGTPLAGLLMLSPPFLQAQCVQ